ncbi:MAG: O-antigen ligase domain-containing protein [Thiothrix sp.]|nr:MAG: O-antigen ligase domain-containing protein [Thiothrix sp.]
MSNLLDKISNKNLIIIAISLIFLAVLPFLISSSFHDSQRLISTIFIGCLLTYSLLKYEIWRENELRVLLIFLSMGLMATIHSLDSFWSTIELFIFLNIFLFTISFTMNINGNKIKHLALIFTLVQLIYACRSLANYFMIIASRDKIDAWVIIDGFDNIRFYAQFLSWTLPFIIGYLALQDRTRHTKLILITASLSFALAFITGTRAFILGMIFTVISVFIFAPNWWARYLKYLLTTSSIGAFIYLLMIFLIPTFFGIDNHAALESTVHRDFTNSSGRVEIWMQTIHIAFNNPWLGIGPMMTAADGALKTVAHPHNFILQLMAEWGLPFTILFLFLTIYLIHKWRKLIAQNPINREPLALPMTAALSSAFAASLVDGVMVMPVSLTYMAIIIGATINLMKTWTPEVPNFKLSTITRFTLILPAFLLLAVTIYQWEFVDLKKQNSLHTAPRFWSDGKITTKISFIQHSTKYTPLKK